jgi:ABC-type uncharacterized transport system ATPase subunit
MWLAVTGLRVIVRTAEIVVGEADDPAAAGAIVDAVGAADVPVVAGGIVGAAGLAGDGTNFFATDLHGFTRIRQSKATT